MESTGVGRVGRRLEKAAPARPDPTIQSGRSYSTFRHPAKEAVSQSREGFPFNSLLKNAICGVALHFSS
ncbi:MAG: hypothetical protein ACLFOY_19030, partial [Desulfatibacillaceae bacterium]